MDIDQRVILTLKVPSVEGTAAWYERVLGWNGHFDTFDEDGRCLFGSVKKRDAPGLSMNLAYSKGVEEGDWCHHCSIWIYVKDIAAIYSRVLVQGWQIEDEIANQFWGERQFRIRDINGNELVFVQPFEELGLEEIRERHRKLQQQG